MGKHLIICHFPSRSMQSHLSVPSSLLYFAHGNTCEIALYARPIQLQLKTDVFGVYDRPPTEPDAVLLREIGKYLKR